MGLAFVSVIPCLAGQAHSSGPRTVKNQTQNEAGTASVPNQAASAFARYSGYRIRSVSLKGAQRIEQSDMLKSIPLQPGQILDRATVRASLQQLFATGRFRTIAAEVTPSPDRFLDVNLVVEEKLFIGSLVVYGAPRPPSIADQELDDEARARLVAWQHDVAGRLPSRAQAAGVPTHRGDARRPRARRARRQLTSPTAAAPPSTTPTTHAPP